MFNKGSCPVTPNFTSYEAQNRQKIEKFGVSLSYLCANEDFYRGKNGKVSGYTEHTLCEIYFRYKIDSQYLLNQHILGLNPENNKQQNSAE